MEFILLYLKKRRAGELNKIGFARRFGLKPATEML
jgi:hypothetical protein